MFLIISFCYSNRLTLHNDGPIERLWEHLKQDLKWELFDDLKQLQNKVDELIHRLTPQQVASITGYGFILDALSVANIF